MLDHETQIRPRAQKNFPHRGKHGGRVNFFQDCNGAARNTRYANTARASISSFSRKAHTLLSRSLSGAPSDPYNRAVMCHLCCLLAYRGARKILAKRTRVDQDLNRASHPG